MWNSDEENCVVLREEMPLHPMDLERLTINNRPAPPFCEEYRLIFRIHVFRIHVEVKKFPIRLSDHGIFPQPIFHRLEHKAEDSGVFGDHHSEFVGSWMCGLFRALKAMVEMAEQDENEGSSEPDMPEAIETS